MTNKPRLALLSTIAVAALAAMSLPATAVGIGPSAARAVVSEDLVQDGTTMPEASVNGVYIVQMADAPVVAYDGGIKGLRATKPAEGQKINPNSAAVVRYVDYLTARHDAAVARAGGSKLQDYVYSYSGFSAKLTKKQAAAMTKVPGVVAVNADETRTLDTSSTPEFLGLTDPGGLWDQLGDPAEANKKTDGAGEDVIIGIVDGGIWPEHPSVSDRDAAGKLAYQQVPGWHGKCVPGEAFDASLCNQKLIGARYYNAGWGGNAGIDEQLPWEFNSPRDYGGHGTHTATTAGGNFGVPATGEASVFGSVSGMAPRARIAAYKVCWETGSGGSCFNSDSVAAIDQAVADGVDVINFSISGSLTNFRDPVEVAFLYAADAGVFVAASAGNSGPTTSTVAHPGPWLTTVAAGTHNRDGQGSVTLGNGATYEGASVATAVGPARLVDSVDVGLAGASPGDVELCVPGSLDPADVEGAIVICKRGMIARTDKSKAVKEAGGVGMVLYNSPDSSLNADFHFVPTVHVTQADGLSIKAYAATPEPTATINTATLVYNAPAPYTASFSSRGPLQAGSGDLLKPDVIAPGQDILAGVAPPGNNGRLFDLYSGTSMSSPHVAGLAALLMDKHPDWTPAMVKSALMTTGSDVLDGPNTDPTVIFRQGAGHVAPNSAADPGLVFDAGWNDWLSLICATQPEGLDSLCNSLWNAGYSKKASDFNSASIAIGSLAGAQTVTRTVTNVSDAPEEYTVSSTGLAGVTVSAAPATFTLDPGTSQEVEVTFTRTTAGLNAYVGGQITWSGDAGHVVRVPAVVRPVALAAPASVSGSGGPISYEVAFGYTGPFSASARGLVAPVVDEGTVGQDPDQSFSPSDTEGVVAIPVVIPAGSTYARFALFDSDVTPGTDLDLYIYQGSTLVGSSGSGTSNEEVNFAFGAPTGGPITLTAYVHGWGIAGGGTSPFKLHTWGVPATATGNMAVSAPGTATLGESGTIDLTFTGLDPATRYLGSVAYSGAAGMPNPTIVAVTTTP
jgi:Subtilase family/Fibronectin type-III domain/PA domain/Peptidase inhibitor I9